MATKLQHSQATSDKSTRLIGELPFSFQLTGENSLDGNESKERHGAQYHLRHHLSGCAQTLHTIDFTHDFSQSVLEQRTLITPNNMDSTSTSTDSGVKKLLNSDSVTPISPTLVTDSAPSSVSRATSESESGITHRMELKAEHTITKYSEGIATSSVIAERHGDDAEIPYDEGQKERYPTPSSFVTNFDNLSLDGWKLGGSLTPEQVLGDGNLHFSAQSLHEGEALLSHEFELNDNQHYEFQMSLLGDDCAEPPYFILNVGGENYEMNVSREGNYFVMKAEFATSSSGKVNLSIIPINLGTLEQDIWLDGFILKPSVLPQEHHNTLLDIPLLQPEPALEIGHICTIKTEPNHVLNTPLKLSTLLDTAMPELYIEPPPAQLSSYESISIETLTVTTQPQRWNLISTEAYSAEMLIRAETATIAPFDEVDTNYITN